MRRRDFMRLLGGAATTWPLGARAQQGEPLRRIGVLMSTAADDPEGQARIAAFQQGLQQFNWTIGRNVRIDSRWPAGDSERFHSYAAELVTLSPDVILATGSAAAEPLLRATRTIPVVFVVVPDPVGAGFVNRERQRHWIYPIRIWHQWKMAGIAQADRAWRDSGGRSSGPSHISWDRPVRRDPSRCTIPRIGGNPGERARGGRD
jgi:hypothetical protein